MNSISCEPQIIVSENHQVEPIYEPIKMISKKSFIKNLAIISPLFLLTACASLEQEIYKQAQVLEDSVRGYRIQYHTIPTGAKILCNGEEIGVAPIYKYYDLTPEHKTSQILEINNCQAIWPSGALADIQSAIPLNQFPHFVHLVTERPAEAPDYELDSAFGAKTLALRQQGLDAIRSFVALGFGIHKMNKTNKVASGATSLPSFDTPVRDVSSSGGIRWNWVQTDIQPNFGSQTGISSRALTPFYPANSCVGAVVMGRCQGGIVGGVNPSYCGGAVANGKCLGPMLLGE